jgi:hypothetical protein
MICKRRLSFLGACAIHFVMILVVSCVILTKVDNDASAANSGNGTMSVMVNSACGFGTRSGGSYSRSLSIATTTTINGDAINVSCNDTVGYSVYAIGYSGDSYSGTNTDLIHNSNTSYNVKTDASFRNSYWKMKIAVSGGASIVGSYGSFQQIPSSYVQVAKYTTSTTSGVITPSYEIYVSEFQPVGTYSGKVKYTLVHPNNAAAPTAS